MKICSIPDCGRKRLAKTFCCTHYWRFKKFGDPNASVEIKVINKGGISKHPLYRAFCGMINRCHNPNNSSYDSYGARGVVVCDRWRYDFAAFLSDMGERPEGKTLDRIDPAGPYAPDNCRWATPKEQRLNITEAGRERQRKGASAGATRRWNQYRAENV